MGGMAAKARKQPPKSPRKPTTKLGNQLKSIFTLCESDIVAGDVADELSNVFSILKLGDAGEIGKLYARIRTLAIAVQKLQQDIQEAIWLTGKKTFSEQYKSHQLSAKRAEFKQPSRVEKSRIP
jgi:hypothetical protein